MKRMRVMKCPTVEQSLRNCAAVNPYDFPQDIEYIEVITSPDQHYVFTVESFEHIPRGCVGFNLIQRKWATLSIDQEVDVRPYGFDSLSGSDVLCTIVLEADFLLKTKTSLEPYDIGQMAEDFLFKFSGQAFTVGQLLAFPFQDKEMLRLVVKDLEVPNITSVETGHSLESKKVRIGRCLGDAVIKFEKARNSSLYLVPSVNGRTVSYSIINPGWILEKIRNIYSFIMYHISKFSTKCRGIFVKKSD